jgi:peptide/nickel transport system substrate-binding protein
MFKKSLRLLAVSLAVSAMLTLVFGVKAQDAKTLVIGWEQEPDQVAPFTTMTFSQLALNFYGRNVWDWDTNFKIYPIMVTEIPTHENGMVKEDGGKTAVTYHLKPNMKWSDGQPITSADCEFGHKLYSDTSTATFTRGDYPASIESFTKVDDLTFTLTYKGPFPDYTGSGNSVAFAHCEHPAHVLEPILKEKGTLDGSPYVTTAQGLVGYGPYKLESWTKGDNMTFVANENWDGQKPGFDKVVLKFITESAQMKNALETGEIDLAFNWANNLVKDYSAISNAEVFNTTSVYQDAVWFNIRADGNQNPAMKDPKVRLAIIEAIDRVSANAALADGAEIPGAFDAKNWWPANLEIPKYDPENAKKLLDEAGWTVGDDGIRVKDGVKLILRFYSTIRQQRNDYQLAIQQNLRDVGVSVQVFPIQAAVLFADYSNRGQMATGDYDISIYASSNDPISPNLDPGSFSCDAIPTQQNPNGQNFSGVCDKKLDELIQQIPVETDPAKRLDMKHESVKILSDLNFWAGLYPRLTWYAARTDVLDTSTIKDMGTLASNYFEKVEYWKPAS